MSAQSKLVDRASHDAAAAELIGMLKIMVVAGDTTPEQRIQCIEEAFQAGKSVGHLAGMEEMGESMLASLDHQVMGLVS